MRPVQLVDTSLRDGNQSLWGATGLTTGMVEAVGPALERAGYRAIDFTSSTHLAVGVRWHREDPWERIRRMRAVAATTPLSLITTGMRFVTWDRSPLAVMELAMRLLARHGIGRIQISEPTNDVDAACQVARMAKKAGIDEVVGAVVFTESPVHTDDLFTDAAARLDEAAEIDAVYLKDPGGLLTVDRARSLIPRLRAAVAGVLELHGHCTTGVAPLVYVEAAQLGVDVLHTGAGALAEGTAQPEVRRLAANLRVVGIDVAVDLEAVDEAARVIAAVARGQRLAPGRPSPYDLTAHHHQIPGGMMGTLRRQLDEVSHAGRLDEVLAEVRAVREELGWPIMVTPYSQLVGTQAVMNVVTGQRWQRMPDEVIRYVLGHFGSAPGPIAAEVRERVAAAPRTTALDAPRDDPGIDALRDGIERQLGREVADEEELLARLVLPADQVDAMRAAGPAPAWSPEGMGPAGFLRAVEELPRWRHLRIVRGGDSIELRRAGEDPAR